jgi:hypothetical protein
MNGGFRPKHHWIWFDENASQFKSKIPFYFMNDYPHLTSVYYLVKSFFGSRHGKSPHDGAGAVLKRFIKQVQFNVERPKIQNAEQVVNLFCSHLNTHLKTSYSGHRIPIMHTFWHVNVTSMD